VFSQAIGTEVQEHSALRNNVLGLEEFLFQWRKEIVYK
jgi:hypothetical protein